MEFLKRFSSIIPPPRVNLVRYGGALGPRSALRSLLCQAARRKVSCVELSKGWNVPPLLAGLLSQTKDLAFKAVAGAWARCLGRVFEAFPILCEPCGLVMLPVAVITESRELTRLLKHLGLPHEFPIAKPARSPPQARFSEDSQFNPLAESSCGIDEAASPSHWPLD